MNFKRTTSHFGKVGIVLSLVMTAFLVSDAAAQDPLCECVDAYDTVAVRTVPVRRTARKYRAKRAHRRAVRTTAVAAPAVRTVYVPVRRVEYVPQHVAYIDDDDCDDDLYAVDHRVYVTERVYTNGYNGRKVHYTNGSGYNGERVYVTNGYGPTAVYTNNYVNKRIYTNGSYGNLAVDANYFETTRIAADYGHRDGFDDGHEVAMEREAYNPHKEGDYRNGTNGYEGDFGAKWLYRQAYRDAYLRGYNAGFRSVAQSSTYSVIRY